MFIITKLEVKYFNYTPIHISCKKGKNVNRCKNVKMGLNEKNIKTKKCNFSNA